VVTESLDINALLSLDDRDFIERAYVALLKRKPDESGMQNYLSALAAGRSRILVLGELRYSAEGRAAATPVLGLRRRYLLHRLYRLRVVGRLVRTLTGLIALPGLLRDVSRLWTELHALRVQSRNSDASIDREMRSRADSAERTLRSMKERVDQLTRYTLEEPWADPLLALAERFDVHSARFDRMGGLIEAVARDARITAEFSEALTALREHLGWPEQGADLLRRFAAMQSEHRNLAARALGAAEDTKALLRDQERRLSLILAEVRTWLAHGTNAASPASVMDQQDRLLDPLYVAFEDRFRGSRADIKQRQSVYLDLLRQAGAGASGRPIVDVGSGRGELLELLGEQGLEARGVDLNEAMVSLCVKAGLDCTHADAVAYLGRLDAGSLGAVTGFHIIEHLPFPVMVALFDASLRALAPGGIVVFETPNPANLIVASRWFHLDPTHRNPLPAEMVAMIAEARGFIDVSIRELHPMQRRFEARDDVLAAQLDAIFHGPQDYALIARKA
jgi:2-polyprenyl-3-methyl-5-hydroxy-6-metoxy-1,4-benzoquinol methylase